MSDFTLVNMVIAKSVNGKIVYKHNMEVVFRLIAVLENAGYGVSFHEHALDIALSFSEEIERFLADVDTSAPVIGLGCHSVHLPFVVKAAEALKTRFPDKKVILGGIGPSGVAAPLLEKFPSSMPWR